MIGVLGLLLALTAPPDSAEAPCPWGEVITRAEIEASGATTLHDLFRLQSVLQTLTVDGFDRQPVAPWGAAAGAPVRLLIDGAPAAGTTSIEPLGVETLPVALREVARVVVCPGPGVAGGRFGGAWLDVQTEPPPSVAYGAVSYGNETGDPGPDRYLRPDLPNVDHWGPDFEAALALRRGPSAAWATLRDRGFFPTDTAMAARVFDAVEGFPARSETVGAFAARIPGTHIRVGGVRGGDLPYLPAVVREVPVSRRALGATALVRRQRGRLAMRGHTHLARLSLQRPAWSTLPLDPAWTETRADLALSTFYGRGGASAAAGASLEHVAAEGPDLRNGSASAGRLWGQVERRRPLAAQSLTVQGALSESGGALSASLDARQRLQPNLALRLTLAAHETLPEEMPDASYWISRGYTGLALDRVELRVRQPRPATRLLARVGVTARLGRAHLAAVVDGQRTREDVLLTRAEATETAPAGLVRQSLADGSAVRGALTAMWSRRRVSVRASGTVQAATGGNAAFREVWRRRPVAAAALRGTIRPDARLALWARLAAQSATEWTGFPTPHVPAAVLLDLGLSKRAWGDRLRASLSGRNVLGAQEQTHPLGATLAPRLLIRLEVQL